MRMRRMNGRMARRRRGRCRRFKLGHVGRYHLGLPFILELSKYIVINAKLLKLALYIGHHLIDDGAVYLGHNPV